MFVLYDWLFPHTCIFLAKIVAYSILPFKGIALEHQRWIEWMPLPRYTEIGTVSLPPAISTLNRNWFSYVQSTTGQSVNKILWIRHTHTRGVVVSGIRQWTKLTHVGPGYNWDGWPSSDGYTISGCNQPTRSTQHCIPPGSLNRVPASAGVKAGMSPLPGGR